MGRRRRLVLLAGAAGLGVGVAVAVRRARDARPEPADVDRYGAHGLPGEELRLSSLDGADLAVHVAGPADGPAVVLAHCWTGSRHVWGPVSRRLVAAGCRVVRWDQRGHGASVAGHKGHSIEGLADDLATVLASLDLGDVVLVGHSMGGMTVQALATHHHGLFHERARAAVLVATAAYMPLAGAGGVEAPDVLRNALVERLFERPVTGRLLIRGVFGRAAHPHHVEATRADFVATPPEVRAEFAQAMAAMDLREGIARIDVPTTIVAGTRDTLTPLPLSRVLAATIPGAELQVLRGYGHMLPYEAPDVVADAVLAHVREPDGAAVGAPPAATGVPT